MCNSLGGKKSKKRSTDGMTEPGRERGAPSLKSLMHGIIIYTEFLTSEGALLGSRAGQLDVKCANIRGIYEHRLVAPDVVQARSGAPETIRDRRTLNATIGRLADPENAHAKRETRKEEDPGRAWLSSFPLAGSESESGGQFDARGEQACRRDAFLAHPHYVVAQSPLRHAVCACTLVDALCRRARTTLKSTGERAGERDSRLLRLPRTVAGTKVPTPRMLHATTRATAPKPGSTRRHVEPSIEVP
ncbi:hypothetical protein FB451DRAFT_1176724 [Mycena latifolia]|nr:hypothetical protein FB451DRAFT_1176724 [Mycena latifolia]